MSAASDVALVARGERGFHAHKEGIGHRPLRRPSLPSSCSDLAIESSHPFTECLPYFSEERGSILFSDDDGREHRVPYRSVHGSR
jgi:hypothetical protein